MDQDVTSTKTAQILEDSDANDYSKSNVSETILIRADQLRLKSTSMYISNAQFEVNHKERFKRTHMYKRKLNRYKK